MNPLTSFFTALISPVTEILKGKQAITAAKNAATVEAIKRSDVSDISLDTNARTQAGLMDDISFYIFLSPAVLSFYPPALPHIMAGFKALEQMPQWWQAALGMMLVSVWGYRKLVSPIIQSIAKAYLKR